MGQFIESTTHGIVIVLLVIYLILHVFINMHALSSEETAVGLVVVNK